MLHLEHIAMKVSVFWLPHVVNEHNNECSAPHCCVYTREEEKKNDEKAMATTAATPKRRHSHIQISQKSNDIAVTNVIQMKSNAII